MGRINFARLAFSIILLNIAYILVVESVQAKGNPYAVINVKTARSFKKHPLHSTKNITLWCQVALFFYSLFF